LIEFLGTGGAITTPRPLCDCRVCSQARREGVPYSRSGPSLFVHGPDVLIDTPEEIKYQLNRSRVKQIAACFYSHWHPDHVMGRRVFDLNMDWINWPPQSRCTDVYLPGRVGSDFRQRLGSWDHLAFLEQQGVVRLVELEDGETLEIEGIVIRPFPVAVEYVYAFMFEEDGRRALIAPDELVGWEPPVWVRGADLAVIPMGVAELNPLTGERRIAQEHPMLQMEATFEETLEIIEALNAERVVLTHIEEVDGLTHDDLQELQRRLRGDGLHITFAFDTMTVEV
jgi:phosphoribosyl 1,2-cyclic phosphate phosphodiesterase